MIMTIAIFGLIIFALSAWGFFAPKTLARIVLDQFDRPWGLYLAVGVRLVLGALFIMVADETRFPAALRFFGYLMLIAAAMIPLIGRRRISRFMEWLQSKPPALMRIWLIFGVAFGAFLVYAVV